MYGGTLAKVKVRDYTKEVPLVASLLPSVTAVKLLDPFFNIMFYCVIFFDLDHMYQKYAVWVQSFEGRCYSL